VQIVAVARNRNLTQLGGDLGIWGNIAPEWQQNRCLFTLATKVALESATTWKAVYKGYVLAG